MFKSRALPDMMWDKCIVFQQAYRRPRTQSPPNVPKEDARYAWFDSKNKRIALFAFSSMVISGDVARETIPLRHALLDPGLCTVFPRSTGSFTVHPLIARFFLSVRFLLPFSIFICVPKSSSLVTVALDRQCRLSALEGKAGGLSLKLSCCLLWKLLHLTVHLLLFACEQTNALLHVFICSV